MKRKVNINRPEISPEEIIKRKNFDSVLKHHTNAGGKPFFKKPWFMTSVIVATVALVTTLVLLNNDKKREPLNDTTEQTTDQDSQALEVFYKKEEAKPCINPPLSGLNVTYATYKVIAEKGAKVDFKTGSTITIPKNAFADENGKILKGEIELRYREFHDAADFFVSGIPMTYDSAGVRYQFESAGMIEVLAFQNGKQVNMAPEKKIDIELASDYAGTEYNLYKLDTMKNNWSCLGKDKVVAKKEGNSKTLEEAIGKVAIEQTPEYKTIETQKVEIKKVKEAEMAALPKPASEPKKPEQVKKGKYTFNLDVDAKEFPELSVYKGLLFEVGDENTSFNKSMYDIVWDEAIIKEGNKAGENYNLTLKKGAKKYDLLVYPVFEGKNYETAMKDYQEKFNKYKTTLDKRIANEKRIEEELQAKIAQYEKEKQALILKYKQQEADHFKQMDTDQKVRRMFAVNSFGVYNCDSPGKYPKGVLCIANLKAEKDRDLQCYEVYLVDKQKNGLFTYSRNPISAFSFDPNSRNLLWTVENGVLYWLKPEQFANITGGQGLSKLIMNRVDQKFASLEELKIYFNF